MLDVSESLGDNAWDNPTLSTASSTSHNLSDYRINMLLASGAELPPLFFPAIVEVTFSRWPLRYRCIAIEFYLEICSITSSILESPAHNFKVLIGTVQFWSLTSHSISC